MGKLAGSTSGSFGRSPANNCSCLAYKTLPKEMGDTPGFSLNVALLNRNSVFLLSRVFQGPGLRYSHGKIKATSNLLEDA